MIKTIEKIQWLCYNWISIGSDFSNGCIKRSNDCEKAKMPSNIAFGALRP